LGLVGGMGNFEAVSSMQREPQRMLGGKIEGIKDMGGRLKSFRKKAKKREKTKSRAFRIQKPTADSGSGKKCVETGEREGGERIKRRGLNMLISRRGGLRSIQKSSRSTSKRQIKTETEMKREKHPRERVEHSLTIEGKEWLLRGSKRR